MIVNTKSGLKLNTTEQRLLAKASALLRLIEKHGGDCEAESSRVAAVKIDETLEGLLGVDETTLVGAK
jgi:hypothetical protein